MDSKALREQAQKERTEADATFEEALKSAGDDVAAKDAAQKAYDETYVGIEKKLDEADNAEKAEKSASEREQRKTSVAERLKSADRKERTTKAHEPEYQAPTMVGSGGRTVKSDHKAVGWLEEFPAYVQDEKIVKDSGEDIQAEAELGERMVKSYLLSADDMDFATTDPEGFKYYRESAKAAGDSFTQRIDARGGVYVASSLLPSFTPGVRDNPLASYATRRTVPTKRGTIPYLTGGTVQRFRDIETVPVLQDPNTGEIEYSTLYQQTGAALNNDILGAANFMADLREQATDNLIGDLDAASIIGGAIATNFTLDGTANTSRGLGDWGATGTVNRTQLASKDAITLAEVVGLEDNLPRLYTRRRQGSLVYVMHRTIWNQCKTVAVASVQGQSIIDIGGQRINGRPVIIHDSLAAAGATSVVALYLNAAWIQLLTWRGLNVVRVPHNVQPHLGIRWFYWGNMDVVYAGRGAVGTERANFAVQINSQN